MFDYKSASFGTYSTLTDCFGKGLLNKPKSYILNEIEFWQILMNAKDKF